MFAQPTGPPLYGPVPNDPGYVVGGSAHATQVASGAFLEIVLASIISPLSAVTVSQRFAAAGPADAPAYLAVGKAPVAIHDWTFLFGPNLALGPSTVMMAWFLYRSRLVPRFVLRVELPPVEGR